MLDWLLLGNEHAISILKKDHEVVKSLFEKFEKADSASMKEKIIQEALAELKMHAVLEEEIFYPAVRKKVGGKIMNEADEEHHVARVLIAELDRNGTQHDHREAKFTVLAESVRHHIKEEEGEMLPKAKEVDVDFDALGKQMLRRKEELRKDGVPIDAEHRMIAKINGRDDTPAMASRRKAQRTRSSEGTTRRRREPAKRHTARSKKKARR